MSTIFKDRLTFLTRASGKVENMTKELYDYLLNQFNGSRFVFSRKNVFGQVIHVVKEMMTLAFSYLEDANAEQNVYTMSKEASVRHWGEISGHNVVRAISSRGVGSLQFTPGTSGMIGRQIIIQKYAQLRNDLNALVYLVNISEDQLVVSTDVNGMTIPLIEGSVAEQTFAATGQKLFTIELDDVNIIEHYDIAVYVDGVKWEKFESLYDMGVTDKGYMIKTGLTNQVDIIFGNGIQGAIPRAGAVVRVVYLFTTGEIGNFDENQYPEFTFVSGVTDMQGNDINTQDTMKIIKVGGFDLGSNGESFDDTRAIIGWNSRSLVFAIDENFVAYLRRLSFVGRIQIKKDPENTNVKKLVVLPNIKNKTRSFNDYLNADKSEFTLTAVQKNSIKSMIENSKRTFVASELIFEDPIVKNYAIVVSIEPRDFVYDETMIKDRIKAIIVDHFINKTFSSINFDSIISKTELISKLHTEFELIRCGIVFIGQENEEAKIRGWYNKLVTENVDGVTRKSWVRTDVPVGTDPLIGFNSHGDINVTDETEIPIIRGGFDFVSNGSTYHMTESITVILNNKTV